MQGTELSEQLWCHFNIIWVLAGVGVRAMVRVPISKKSWPMVRNPLSVSQLADLKESKFNIKKGVGANKTCIAGLSTADPVNSDHKSDLVKCEHASKDEAREIGKSSIRTRSIDQLTTCVDPYI